MPEIIVLRVVVTRPTEEVESGVGGEASREG